ncbi:MAG: acyltransferase [Methylobacterium frigidaeris]
MKSLNQLKKLRNLLVYIKRIYFIKFWGMDLHETVQFSLSAKLDTTYPKGIHIGEGTYIAFDATILAHDMIRGYYKDTRIGKNCFIGAKSIILPGIIIEDECIVAAGSVVTSSVPFRSIVAGNPARIIRSGTPLKKYGRLPTADENIRSAIKQRKIY